MGKRLLLMSVLFFAVSLGLVLLPVGTASAQGVCGIDIKCTDPKCVEDPVCKEPPPPPKGVPCSPGFWKNHEAEFNAFCAQAAAIPNDQFASCGDLLTALTCKGSDASCLRSIAAAALNTVSGCEE
jgi:hypothetical protein